MLGQEEPPKAAEADRAVVLVVDDEYGPRESVAFALSTEFAVDTADRAMEALAKIKERPFSCVILDIRMPEMDGIRALEEIRKIDPLVGVIMLTGYGTLLTAQLAMVGGANQYLRKPPDIEELLGAVRTQAKATGLRRHNARLAAAAVELNSALKREIEQTKPQVWQGRASVELVHDLNNPLTVVIGYSSLVSEEAKALSEHNPEMAQKLLEYATMVEKAAEYCHHLSENWRQASKKLSEMVQLDLVQVARDVKQVIFFGNASIAVRGAPEAVILGSKFELMRVFQNLLKNSLEAGAKSVEIAFVTTAKGVEVVISDNGTGMDPERLRLALKGGFSNKESGTGLGLGICGHLVAAHGGTFDIQSQPAKGTIVRMSFPAAPKS